MRRAAIALTAGLVLAACGGSSHSSTSTSAGAHLELTSPAFANESSIPRTYTCDGRDISPPLRWSGVPANATQLSLTMVDPDAPGGTFHHWSVRFPATVGALAAGEAPSGAVEGRNDFGSVGYRGPCPPPGASAHHYVITLIALSGGSVVASGTLTGTYARR